MKSKDFDYKKLNQELEDILDKLREGNLDIDESIKLYDRGSTIIVELEDYLKNAENKIKKITK